MTRLEQIAKYMFAAVFVASVVFWAVYTIKLQRAKLVLDCTHTMAVETYMRKSTDFTNVDQIRRWCDEFIDESGRFKEVAK